MTVVFTLRKRPTNIWYSSVWCEGTLLHAAAFRLCGSQACACMAAYLCFHSHLQERQVSLLLQRDMVDHAIFGLMLEPLPQKRPASEWYWKGPPSILRHYFSLF
jgi:hypothetical protein